MQTFPATQALTGQAGDVDFEDMWATLSSSFHEIHTKNASKLSFEELYRTAYKLVLKKKGEILYDRVKEFEKEWLSTNVRTRIRNLLSASLLASSTGGMGGTTVNEKRAGGERFLKGLKQAWEDHNLCMNMTTDVLMYMKDRVYCLDQRRPSIFKASMGLFRDHILGSKIAEEADNTTISTMLTTVILDQIRMERDGDIIDKNLIRSCIYMLEGLYVADEENESTKLYTNYFEPEFLDASRMFYRAEGDSLLIEADAGTFCKNTKKRINEEQDRCRSTLSPLTAPKIKLVLEQELIKNNIHEVICMEGSGARFMLDNDKIEELQMLYDLESKVDPAKEELKKAVQKRVVELGSEINNAASVPSQAQGPAPAEVNGESAKGEAKAPPVNVQTVAAIKWVDDVLQLKDKYDAIWSRAFDSDQGLQTALTRSFSEFINTFQRSSEFISLFLDENLKKGLKGKTENEVDAVLEKAITLLRYVQDKDMFERYYKKHLCRRLLMGKSLSTEVEKQMISRMKMEVGTHFTQKLEGMFKDMTVSEDLSTNFKNHVARLGDPDPRRVELGINVLTSTVWPLEAIAPSSNTTDEVRPKCIFPPAIERIKQGFENFYAEKHNGRVLDWQANMGTADIRAVFPKVQGREAALNKERKHELNVSTYAMVILLLFNDLPPGESYTFEELRARTNIPQNELTRNLQSLAVAPKTRVLIKEPMSKDVKPTDRFYFNENFHSKFLKIKVGVVTSANKVEGDKERTETEKRNNDTRAGVIEAAVVRIMKQRKKLSHQLLINEVITQLASRFQPDIHMVKKRIESLIEREYLQRLENSSVPTYEYLA
ncbi:MAG: Cullin-3 [Candelina mexicana]|nr:MAG: Cullin-3 [Candelina mexicana]